jgi:hypothetical protein
MTVDPMIEIHNPIYGMRDQRSERGRVDFPTPKDGDVLNVVFIDNEKPNTTHMLKLVEKGLRSRFKVESLHLFKGGAAHPAPEEIIRQAAEVAHIAVMATAD